MAALWLDHRTLNREDSGSNLLAVISWLGQFVQSTFPKFAQLHTLLQTIVDI